MSDLVDASAPAPAQAPAPVDLAAQRLAEAPIIESEWNAMSYKDRAAWWMSAKWYGYMSTEAYRRGDPAHADISCRYGEPGFFIATRVPYYEAQAAVSTIVAIVSEPVPTAAPEPESASVPSVPITSAPEQVVPTEEKPAVVETPEPASIVQEAITNSISETQTPILAAAMASNGNVNSHKKKKKKHNKPANPGEGKTIEIKVGGQSK